MRRGFPAASFGKAGGARGSGDDQYRVLCRSADFPDAAIQQFERLAASVQWTGGGGDAPYSDCFALWPAGRPHAALAGRLRDAGPDQLGRPHSLRIDVAYLEDAELVRSPQLLAALLRPEAWPSGSWSGPPQALSLQLEPTDDRLASVVQEASGKSGRIPRLLVASHTHIRSQDFDAVTGPRQAGVPVPPRTRKRRSGGVKGQTTAVDRRTRGTVRWHAWRIWILAIACALVVGLTVLSIAERRRLNRELVHSRRQLDEREAALAGLQKRFDDEAAAHRVAEKRLSSYEETQPRIHARLGNLEEAVEDLDRRLDWLAALVEAALSAWHAGDPPDTDPPTPDLPPREDGQTEPEDEPTVPSDGDAGGDDAC